MELDDKELVRQIKAGNRHSFEVLVSRYKRKLYSVIYRMTRNHHITDELLQDTFLKLYSSSDKYDEKYPFYPWLHRIAVNTTINYIKKESRRSGEKSLEQEMEERHIQPEQKRNHYDPESGVIMQEKDRKILSALQEISPTYREALILRVFENYSYKEIAEILKVNMGTVMSRLNRARAQLKDILSDYLFNGNGKNGNNRQEPLG